jgi:steroid 5-alpha reductase family enzyme
MVGLWALRLSGYIWLRKQGHGEDPRYQAWRQDWGKWVVIRSLVQVFLVQGSLLSVISVPAQQVMILGEVALTAVSGLGVLIWLTGLVYETVADWQLWRFKRDPQSKGKVFDQGLWRYSRHPNYFGETLVWWGICLLAVSLGVGWWVVIGPLTITFLLLKVSGVTLLEKRYHGNKSYQSYQRRTSPFIPWWPASKEEPYL